MSIAVNAINSTDLAKKALAAKLVKMSKYCKSSRLQRLIFDAQAFAGKYFDDVDQRGGDAIRFAIVNLDKSLLPELEKFKSGCPGHPFSITADLAALYVDNGPVKFLNNFLNNNSYDSKKYFSNWSTVFEAGLPYCRFPGLKEKVCELMPTLKGHHAISAELLLEDIKE